MIVLTDLTHDRSEYIGIYKIFTVNNVKSYTNCNKSFDSWSIETEDIVSEMESNTMYFMIDTLFNEAFSHWVYECAIYLDVFLRLKERYPAIKLHLKNYRKFKQLFCTLFGINHEDIVYTIHSMNTCFFPSPISLMNNKHLSPEYTEQLRIFFLRFNEYKHKLTDTILIMPRQREENFNGNERSYNMNKVFDFYIKMNSSHEILHTDTILDIKEQIRKVSSAKTIVLTDGSPFLVNGMFAQNSNILILDILTKNQSCNYPKMAQIIDNIKRINNVTYEYFSSVDSLYEALLSENRC
jgi:hypothetical protein